MLKYVILFIAVAYIGFLCYLKLYKQNQTKKILLVIQQNVPPQSLEWMIYSFHRFLERNHLQQEWWIYVEDCRSAYEKNFILRRMARRFRYKTQERYYQNQDFVYVFFAAPNCKPHQWQQQLNNHLQSAKKCI